MAGDARVRTRVSLGALALLALCGPLLAATAPTANWRFDEGSGTTAADSSNNGNTGTLTNSPTWTTGQIGDALNFNGGSTSVAVGTNSDLTNLYSTGATVMAWIRPTGAGGSGAGRIVDKDNPAGWFFAMNSSSQVEFVVDQATSGAPIRYSTSSIALNTWQHVAVTWDGSASGSNIHIYINGVAADGTSQDGTGPMISDSGAPATIGNRALDDARGFAGDIDEVRVYNRVLSAAEIETIANDSQPPTAPSGLTATAVSGSEIDLQWNASSDNVAVAGYLIERCSGSSCSDFAQIASPTTTTYQDTGLTASTSYSYRIRAIDTAYNYGSYSSTASATTQSGADTTPPTAPTNLAATAISGSQMNLTWTASTDNVGVTGYDIERCSGPSCSSFTQIGSSTSASYSDSGLTASTSYSYRVRATDAAGNLSSYSNTASATTPSGSSWPIANWKFDEGSGSTAADSSGNGNSGTLTNGPSWAAGEIGDALSFNGGSSLVAVGTPSDLTDLYSTGMTVMAWIRPTSGGSSAGRIVDKDNPAGWFFAMSGSSQVEFVVDQATSGAPIRYSTSSIALNTWQHVAVTWDGSASGSNIHIYINGVAADGTSQDGTGPMISDSGAPATIGNRGSDSARGLSGDIDEVRIYNRVLSAVEIQTIANDTQPPSAPSGLTATVVSSSEIDLTWTASTDNVGVTGYYVERCPGTSCTNFVQIGATTGTTYPDTGLSASTSYSYRVRATDAAGNLGGYSNSASGTTSSGGGGGGGSGCSAMSTLTYTYDSQGHLQTVTGAGGCSAQYTYDPNGNLTSVQVSQ